jgi:proline racemase
LIRLRKNILRLAAGHFIFSGDIFYASKKAKSDIIITRPEPEYELCGANMIKLNKYAVINGIFERH